MLERAKYDLKREADGILALIETLDGAKFEEAVGLLSSAHGRVVVTGMGKNGHIAGKIAATMASCGTPAFFLHPGEALHGDLGMVTPDDVLLALSNSGENYEVLRVIDGVREYMVPVIGITSRPTSPLAIISDVALITPNIGEACPLGLAPTISTTVMLALGDALALAVMRTKSFSAADFKRLHPAGALGRK
jgi:arabinose-5-phosphate isomerase